MNPIALLGVVLAASGNSKLEPVSDRFIFASPLPSLAPVMLDKSSLAGGVAQQLARSKGLQGRVLWVDATANIERYNSEEKIIALVDKAHSIGFNTIVLDVKPIVGYTIYPSSLTDKLRSWKGHAIPEDFDPVPIFVRESKAKGLSIFLSMNAFSEGHRMAKDAENDPNSPFGPPGPGYGLPNEQTVQYVPVPYVRLGSERIKLNPNLNPKTLAADEVGLYDGAPTVAGSMVYVDSRGFVLMDRGRGLPDGSKVMVGQGAAAKRFIERFALPGRKLDLTTEPTFLPAGEVQNQIPLMMNPLHPNVRRRVIEFAKEAVLKYPIDGLLFDDRLRFGGIDADFSQGTRASFETHVRGKLNWPDDVFKFTWNWDMSRGVKPGPYWDRWWAWRAKQLQSWVISVRREIKKLNPETKFGIYAGSWYGEYTKWGANYGRPGRKGPFASQSKGFADAGFADQLDVFIAGCYYPMATIAEALGQGRGEGSTVEAGAALANQVIHDQAWTYAGIMLQSYFSDPMQLENALQAAVASSQGVMVFDLSHRFDEFEPILRRAFKFPAKAPHQANGLLEQVRKLQASREKLGQDNDRIPSYVGTPGVGH